MLFVNTAVTTPHYSCCNRISKSTRAIRHKLPMRYTYTSTLRLDRTLHWTLTCPQWILCRNKRHNQWLANATRTSQFVVLLLVMIIYVPYTSLIYRPQVWPWPLSLGTGALHRKTQLAGHTCTIHVLYMYMYVPFPGWGPVAAVLPRHTEKVAHATPRSCEADYFCK